MYNSDSGVSKVEQLERGHTLQKLAIEVLNRNGVKLLICCVAFSYWTNPVVDAIQSKLKFLENETERNQSSRASYYD